MRDTYTNSIIIDNDWVILKHKMNRIRWHAVKTVENLLHGGTVLTYAVKTVYILFHGVDIKDIQWWWKLINHEMIHGR